MNRNRLRCYVVVLQPRADWPSHHFTDPAMETVIKARMEPLADATQGVDVVEVDPLDMRTMSKWMADQIVSDTPVRDCD